MTQNIRMVNGLIKHFSSLFDHSGHFLHYCHIHMVLLFLPTTHIWGIFGFSILHKDTSTCELEEPGIKPRPEGELDGGFT